MPQIPTPPESREGSPSEYEKIEATEPEASELLQSLDTLLEQYLHLLDRQQHLQAGLSGQLSSGFLSLAHANYTCPPGRRYGADYYDDRMKATKQIVIQHSHVLDEADKSDKNKESYEYTFRVESVPKSKSRSKEDEQEADNEDPEKASQNQTKKGHANPSTAETEIEKDLLISEPEPSSQNKKNRKFQTDDPIHWYGILVPRSLRTAQESFTTAVQCHVSELAGAVLEMRALEEKITEIRTKL